MATLRVVITGRVQGVGFRDFVRRQADSLDVTGEVWNRSDGAVEAIVHHPNLNQLGEFVQAMRRGPGSVEDVSASPSPDQTFSDFRIVRQPG
jgi:acylphosphatase